MNISTGKQVDWARLACRFETARRRELMSCRIDKLWSGQGRDAEARKLLAPIYDEFTDGIDLPDLDDARGLLDRLGRPVSG